MLKSIVNGAEHDIVSIPMKGKNLWNPDSRTNNQVGQLNWGVVLPAGVYTIVNNSSAPVYQRDGVDSTQATTFAAAGATKTARFNNALVAWTSSKQTQIMLNIGSTALPYEPYGYQNGWEVRDNQNRLIWGREDELQTITGTLPFKGYDLPIKVKSLLGNGVQNGTPTPNNPIIPEFCGVLNENLAIIESDTRTVTNNYYYDSRISDLLEAGTYTISFVYDSKTAGPSASIGRGDQNSYQGDLKFFAPPANGVLYKTTVTLTSAGYVWARFLRSASQSTFSYSVSKIRIEEGSGAYGWKIPLTNSGQTTPIYLGEVPTIRRIKKLVLTGESNINKNTPSNPDDYLYYLSNIPHEKTDCICSHLISTNSFPSATTGGIYPKYSSGILFINLSKTIMDAQPSGNTNAGFKEYLATQYENGTPLTIWYVLETPEIGIVNEPLCKIGDYADELTTIKVHGLSAPLYGIGEYKDTLNLSTGVVTRKVKRLVLDGSEDGWREGTGFFYNQQISPDYKRSAGNITLMCTHFQPYKQVAKGGDVPNGYCSFYYDPAFQRLYMVVNSITSLADFKAWLAAQYQAGTPVTIWYVLSTPETETVTVPTGMTGEIEGYLTQISTPTPKHQSMPKWNGEEETGGTYAVTVYDLPEIETTTGKNTLTVDTTLAPYNVTINGHIKYTYWGKIREDVRSGLAQTKFPVGTILYDNEDETTGRAFQVVGYDKHFDPSLTARGYNHSMTLCQLKLSGLWQFDATEAFLYTTVEMQPGTYKFKIPNYDTTYGGNKTYYFTSTASVPVDSQITLSWAYQQPPKTVTAYAGPNPQTKTTAITGFNALPLSEWIEGESPEAIDLGTIKLANNDPDSAYGKLNHIHRARYGSNNYYQSGLRQLLNTDLASNNWWHPTTIFDRPYANRTTNGYLRSLNEDFIDVLATPEITHIANNIFEYPSLDGRTFTLNTEYKINTDKVFLLSHTEVGLSASPNIGTVLDYYSTHNTNNDRIKYRIDNGNAYHWWLRTPYPFFANNFRLCNTSGALNLSTANNFLGVAPAYIIQ